MSDNDMLRGGPVVNPVHYNNLGAVCTECDHPIECIDIVKLMNFCLGNSMKYIWRAGNKGSYVQDLQKAIQYLEFEIERYSGQSKS
jgi:hypothetical protein